MPASSLVHTSSREGQLTEGAHCIASGTVMKKVQIEVKPLLLLQEAHFTKRD